ncbi:hypothetical protein [Dyella japonica]|uniref:DGQHR domain-containing protein n=1 Tax=Dyella japonica TaxID=231455 RepID=A0ABV2K0U8_9GAMM
MQNHDVNPLLDLPTRHARGIEWVRVTPAIAHHWLAFNTTNRHVTQHKVQQFQLDMERGTWLNDGAPIRFAPNKLLDGQHRLMAMLQAGTTLPMVVIYGLDEQMQVNMDTGRGRSPVDVFTIEGLDRWQATVLGTAIHALISASRDVPISSTVRYVNREVRDFYLEHIAAIQRTLRVLHDLPRKPTPLPWARAAVGHYLFAKKDHELADGFFRGVYEGYQLGPTQPVLHLRNRLLNDAITKTRRSVFDDYFCLIRAWNATRRGTPWRSGHAMYPGTDTNLPEIV